jgi:hypothetical protein
VAARRPAPTSDSGNGASATNTSGYVASSVVSIDQVTPPTTAGGSAAADGQIDHSGDNGVSLPTDPASPTSGPGAAASASAKGGAGGLNRPGATSGPLARPAGTSNRSTGSTAAGGGEDEGEGPDGGYSATLPFQNPGDAADGLGDGDGEVETMGPGFVKVPKPQDARAVLVPMAGALVVFMLAMQLMVWVRRRPPVLATVHDDFDDWMSF